LVTLDLVGSASVSGSIAVDDASQLIATERAEQPDALKALGRSSARVCAKVRDVLAKAVLLSVADDLRDQV
jgi:hypothetical protein